MATGAGISLTLYQGFLVYVALTTESFRNDFRLYLAAAHVGLDHGFSHLYDLELQRQAVEGLTGVARNYQPFVSPPLAAWMATPLAAFPFQAGLAIWTVLLAACGLGTWWLLAPGYPAKKLAHLLLAIGFLPVGFAVSVGQLAPFIGLAIAVSFVLLLRGRPEVAGLVLVLAWLKPQDALLVAPALLVSGRVRPFVTWLLASAVLGVVTLALLGPHGIESYRSLLGRAAQWDLMRRFSLPGQPFWGGAAPAVSAVVVVTTLVIARRQRSDLGLVMGVGLSGSLLVSPYIGIQDLYLLAPAAWLAWRGGAPTWHLALVAVAYAVIELSLVVGPGPVLLAEVSWLASLALLRRSHGPAAGAPIPGTAPASLPPGPQAGAPGPR